MELKEDIFSEFFKVIERDSEIPEDIALNLKELFEENSEITKLKLKLILNKAK